MPDAGERGLVSRTSRQVTPSTPPCKRVRTCCSGRHGHHIRPLDPTLASTYGLPAPNTLPANTDGWDPEKEPNSRIKNHGVVVIPRDSNQFAEAPGSLWPIYAHGDDVFRERLRGLITAVKDADQAEAIAILAPPGTDIYVATIVNTV
jgi:hypothetical protein